MSKHYLCELARRWGRGWGQVRAQRGVAGGSNRNKHSCTHDGASLQLERKDTQGGKWHAEWLCSRLGWRHFIWLQTCQCGTCVHTGGSALQCLKCPCPHVFPHSPSGELRYISARSYLQVQNPALPWPFIFGCNPGMITAMVFKKYKLSHDIKVVSPLAWEIIQKAPSITGQLDGNYILNQCCLHQQRSWRNSLNYREAIFTGSSSLKITLLPISKHLLISQRLSVFTIPL